MDMDSPDHDYTPAPAPAKRRPRRPRIALMGEFSAGKSTLANLLLGRDVSPVKVTATQLPPIWYTYGRGGAVAVDKDGRKTPVRLDDLNQLSPRDTRAIRIALPAEVLEFCDLIDMPGTSDPNMARDAWSTLLELADGVVWCTAATQAWRQSEAALWEQMPPELWPRSLLLITRMDKMLNERDRARVAARVTREAGEYFRGVYPVSLTEALAARDDDEILAAPGTTAFVDAFIAQIQDIAASRGAGAQDAGSDGESVIA